MADTLDTLLKDMTPLIYNPELLADYLIDRTAVGLEDRSIELLDPNNPFIFGIEALVLTAVASIDNHESYFFCFRYC